jgi:hypothetical protein
LPVLTLSPPRVLQRCTTVRQLGELKDDAWRLQMQMELQKMAGQLEALGQPAGDEEEEPGGDTAQDMGQLDAEIALLDRELAAARIELQGLQDDVAATGQHLEAAAAALTE